MSAFGKKPWVKAAGTGGVRKTVVEWDQVSRASLHGLVDATDRWEPFSRLS